MDDKVYLNKRINPILEQLVMELVLQKPPKLVQFMIDWLKTRGQELENNMGKHKECLSGSEEGSDDEVDAEQLIDVKKLEKIKHQRSSVSAEVYGTFNKKSDFKPKEVKKNKEQIDRIKSRLERAFMFQSLDENEQKIVIAAMEECKFNKNQKVIQQGADGDNLYVVDQGELDCYKRFPNKNEDTHLKVYHEGEAFGELALLYNAPRAATIIAKTDCVLYSLDRQTFNHIVKDAAAKKREKYENFLSKVEILVDMEPYERLQIADALKSQKFQKGQYIVKEGESGEVFFILEEGQAIATKTIEKGKEPSLVYSYKPGDYFGELSLLKNQTRAANVIAQSDCTVVSLERNGFKRLLGPLEEILRRNFKKYEKYMV